MLQNKIMELLAEKLNSVGECLVNPDCPHSGAEKCQAGHADLQEREEQIRKEKKQQYPDNDVYVMVNLTDTKDLDWPCKNEPFVIVV